MFLQRLLHAVGLLTPASWASLQDGASAPASSAHSGTEPTASRWRTLLRLRHRSRNPQGHQEPFVLGPSRHGRGVFAARDLRAGEFILTFSGPLLTLEEVIAKGEAQANPLQVDDRLYLDIGFPGVYVNHSCRPNAGIRGDTRLVALEPIRAGEEIFWDYSTSMWEDHWVMECACGEQRCRGRIGDFPTLPESQQREYLARGVVQRFIRRRLRAGARGGS